MTTALSYPDFFPEKIEIMGKSVKQLTIETTIGRSLPPAEYTSQELTTLSTQLRFCIPLSKPLTLIPFETTDRIDPRLLQPAYLQNVYRSNEASERAQSLGLVLRKIPVILGFEGTLVNRVRIRREQRVQEDMVFREEPDIEARPGAMNFLTSLSEIADLYLCSTEEPNYVVSALDILDWSHYFKAISCETRHKAIARSFPALVNFLPSYIIIDDQIQAWDQQSDRQRLFPSLRFQPSWTFTPFDESLATTVLTYYFSPQHSLTEVGKQAETSFLVSPSGNQFLKLEKALKQSAEEMFYSQYRQDSYDTFQKIVYGRISKKYENMRKIYVNLESKKRRVLEYLLGKLGGRCVREISEANTVCVNPTTTESFGTKKMLTTTEVFNDFFLL